MKSLLKTKTFWGGLAALSTGIGLALTGNLPEGLNAIVAGLLAIFLRDGIRKSALHAGVSAREGRGGVESESNE